MALTAAPAAMTLEEKQNIHPFFTKPQRSHAFEPTPRSAESTISDPPDGPEHEHSEPVVDHGTKKRKKRSASVRDKGKSSKSIQSSLDLFAGHPNAMNETCSHTAAALSTSVTEASDNQSSVQLSKRRKMTLSIPPGDEESLRNESANAQPPEALDWHQQLETEARKGGPTNTEENSGTSKELVSSRAALPQIPADASALASSTGSPPIEHHEPGPWPPIEAELLPSNAFQSIPKKTIIMANKNGKLVLPRASKASTTKDSEPTTPRKRKPRKQVSRTTMITIISYGIDAESRASIGQRIDAILSRSKSVRPLTPKKVAQKPTGPPKATHPFFLAKAVQKPEASESKMAPDARASSPQGPKKSAVTPGKLKADRRTRYDLGTVGASGPMFGTQRPSKQTGLDETPWPTRETAHVRNLDEDFTPPLPSATLSPLLKGRKMKGGVPTIHRNEDIILHLAHQLSATIHIKRDMLASDLEPLQDVRLPERLLTTGTGIQEKVRSQLVGRLPQSTPSPPDLKDLHPAVYSLYCDIEHTLTPFDLAKCDTQSWPYKYAPQKTCDVLQVGNEPVTLRDWLTSLTVMAVGGKAEGSKNANDERKPPKKKRRKIVDDFIVDSDEEEDEEMIELEEKHLSGVTAQREGPPSIKRPRWTRNKNVVVISGPHGCGKSAMVFAVAKELGFEVFEINSGSRRSGKDIHDKVGDMTENHLVNHNPQESLSGPGTATPDDTDSERHSTALQKDLESGRQVTMTSFFKGTGNVTAKPRLKTKSMPSEEPRGTPSGQATLTQGQPKSQKQSLILLEEADILFEEDQQFWAHVSKLATQSKRPIVVTCNDESSIHMHELPLAAVLRLPPPTNGLATDYMLALAGREGHILDRDAVSTLYELKDRDLRASITELHLWCQMSVGDRKGGLEWMYQRWPPGQDVDEHGRTLRVASQRTFQSGMGCVSHNVVQCSNNIVFDKEKELLKEAWADWGVGPHQLIEPSRVYESELSSLANLKRLDALSESVSAADIYCRVALPTYEKDHQQPTDPTLPPMPEKERLNYTTSSAVLQVDYVGDFSQFDSDMLLESQTCIRRVYGDLCTNMDENQPKLPRTEAEFASAIVHHKENCRNASALKRPDFSEALDTLACAPDAIPAMNTSYNLIASSFDRTFCIVVEDLAPYVRSIIAHEMTLEAQRLRLGSLLSEGGSRSKRQRTTRAARTALEGGDRKTKRRERWFGLDLNRVLVMGTAGKNWAGMGSASALASDISEKISESCSSTQDG